jgi:SAM-dependent methyltransferase
LPLAAFDVVCLWDVIEHLDAPVEALGAARAALRPGGYLVASTPVLDGWEARAFGHAWPGWDTPRHLQVFSRASLAAVLRRTGYRVEGWSWLQESWLITALTLTLAARERLPAPLAEGLRMVLHQRLLREVLRPIFRWLDVALRGCAITVVARRVEEVSEREGSAARRVDRSNAAVADVTDAWDVQRSGAANVEAPPCA